MIWLNYEFCKYETPWTVNFSFSRCLLGASFKHWAAKWRNLKKHDWYINFSSMRKCDILVSIRHCQTNGWSTACIISSTVPIIMVSKVSTDLWSQLTSQLVLRGSASHLCWIEKPAIVMDFILAAWCRRRTIQLMCSNLTNLKWCRG